MKIQAQVKLNDYPNSKQRAVADVVFDDCFVVKGVRIMEGKNNGVFISMPSRKVGNEYKSDCFPITKEFKQEFDAAILEAYELKLTQKQEGHADAQEKESQKRGKSQNKAQKPKSEDVTVESADPEQENDELDETQDESVGMSM